VGKLALIAILALRLLESEVVAMAAISNAHKTVTIKAYSLIPPMLLFEREILMNGWPHTSQ
jgi:hypothetical protein